MELGNEEGKGEAQNSPDYGAHEGFLDPHDVGMSMEDTEVMD